MWINIKNLLSGGLC